MSANGRDGRHQGDLLPGVRGTARRAGSRAQRHGGGARPTRRPSTPSSARCTRSRVAQAPSSSTSWSISPTSSRPRWTRSGRPPGADAGAVEGHAAGRRRAGRPGACRPRRRPASTAHARPRCSTSWQAFTGAVAAAGDEINADGTIERPGFPASIAFVPGPDRARARPAPSQNAFTHQVHAHARALRQGQRDRAAAARARRASAR